MSPKYVVWERVKTIQEKEKLHNSGSSAPFSIIYSLIMVDEQFFSSK